MSIIIDDPGIYDSIFVSNQGIHMLSEEIQVVEV